MDAPEMLDGWDNYRQKNCASVDATVGQEWGRSACAQPLETVYVCQSWGCIDTFFRKMIWLEAYKSNSEHHIVLWQVILHKMRIPSDAKVSAQQWGWEWHRVCHFTPKYWQDLMLVVHLAKVNVPSFGRTVLTGWKQMAILLTTSLTNLSMQFFQNHSNFTICEFTCKVVFNEGIHLGVLNFVSDTCICYFGHMRKQRLMQISLFWGTKSLFREDFSLQWLWMKQPSKAFFSLKYSLCSMCFNSILSLTHDFYRWILI